MSQDNVDALKKSAWYTDFNLKPLRFFTSMYYGFLSFYFIYPKAEMTFGRKDIENFLAKTKVKINYIYKHKFYATYFPYFNKGLFNFDPEWKHEIFLPYPYLYQGDLETKQRYYYFTLFHELTHWTGSEHHLNRFDMSKKTKDHLFEYASEEVIATTGCILLMEKFKLINREMKDRALLYMGDYSSHVVYLLVESNYVQKREGWSYHDYIENDEIVKNYLLALMLKAQTAVAYLEKLQN